MSTVKTTLDRPGAEAVPYPKSASVPQTDVARAIMALDTRITAIESGGGGDVTGPGASVDGEVVLFSGTGGATLKRASTSGLAKLTSGVLSAAASGTDYAPATSGSAILKGNGSGGFAAAVSATDYAPATSGTAILKGDGSGGFSAAAAGTDYYAPGGTDVAVVDGGTGAGTAAGARANLGFGTVTTDNAASRYDGSTGATQNSLLTIGDSGELAINGTGVMTLANQATFEGTLWLNGGSPNLAHSVDHEGRYNTFLGIRNGTQARYAYYDTYVGFETGERTRDGYRNTIVGEASGINVRDAYDITAMGWKVVHGAASQVVSGAADNGAGLIRLTVASTDDMLTGDTVEVQSVGGTTEANGDWTINVIDATHIDLQGSTFANAYTSGGSVLPNMLGIEATAGGKSALTNNVGGAGNTAWGYHAGTSVRRSTYSSYFGHQAGANHQWGDYCIFIGGSSGLGAVGPSTAVSGAADNGSGFVRLTVASTSLFATGDVCIVRDVVGTTEANNSGNVQAITVVDATHVDLPISFANAYAAGGRLVRKASNIFAMGYLSLVSATRSNFALGFGAGFNCVGGSGNMFLGDQCQTGIVNGTGNLVIGGGLYGGSTWNLGDTTNHLVLADGAGGIKLYADASHNTYFRGAARSEHATAGIGYAAGAGGSVTQATSRTTGVTLNTVTGAITLVSAAGSTTPATFTVTNSAVAATDTVIVSQKSGTDLYVALVTAVGAGSFNLTVYTTGGTTTEQPVFSFTVVKGVTS